MQPSEHTEPLALTEELIPGTQLLRRVDHRERARGGAGVPGCGAGRAGGHRRGGGARLRRGALRRPGVCAGGPHVVPDQPGAVGRVEP